MRTLIKPEFQTDPCLKATFLLDRRSPPWSDRRKGENVAIHSRRHPVFILVQPLCFAAISGNNISRMDM